MLRLITDPVGGVRGLSECLLLICADLLDLAKHRGIYGAHVHSHVHLLLILVFHLCF